MCVTLVGSMSLSCKARYFYKTKTWLVLQQQLTPLQLTVTFFCVTTQTESLPRTAMLVMPAALTALNAYSAKTQTTFIHSAIGDQTHAIPTTHRDLTDLVQSTFWAEDGDVPIITTASPRHGWRDNSAIRWVQTNGLCTKIPLYSHCEPAGSPVI